MTFPSGKGEIDLVTFPSRRGEIDLVTFPSRRRRPKIGRVADLF